MEHQPSSRHNEFQNVSVSSNYCTNGPWHMWQTRELLEKGRTILHTFLPEYHDMRPFLAHLTLFAFHRQWQRNRQEWWQLWQTVENKGSLCSMLWIWNFTTLLNIWRLTRRLYFFKGQLHSSSIPQRNTHVSGVNLQAQWHLWLHVTWKCTLGETEYGPHTTSQHPIPQQNNW